VEPFVEDPSERRSSKSNLFRSLFKSWFPVRLRKRPPFRAPVLSQRTPILAGSLGKVQGQVEFLRKIKCAPLAAAATRTPYVIYLENKQSRLKTKTLEKHLVAKNRIQLDTSTSTMIYEQDHHRDPTLIFLLAPGTPTWSSLQSCHVG
jgi:hypothetical protein